MYIDDSKIKNKSGKDYRRVLLRNSYRVNGKVHHDTLGNISDCSDIEIEAIKIALKNKEKIFNLADNEFEESYEQGLSFGADWMICQIAKKLGITEALGKSEEAKRSLWMVVSTLIGSVSRLSATRLASSHAGVDIIGLESFCEDDLYDALEWLNANQRKIEKKIFKKHYKQEKPNLFLYDVTSSYFEGLENELADYGYNRDGKKGKKQIVIGLLADDTGWPIACEVFQGNTLDHKTVSNQIQKIAKDFGCEKVTFVGDRGMIKSLQIEEIKEEEFFYITALTKPQIQKKLNENIFDYELFDEKLTEIELDGIRYILKKNPIRANEIKENRSSKLSQLKRMIEKENEYLKNHNKAIIEKSKIRINNKIKKLKIDNWVEINNVERKIELKIIEENLQLQEKLDGCYVITTNLSVNQFDTQAVHNNYKNLKEVEWAFRTMKTTLLDLRGIFVRKENRTRAHVFIMMISYMIAFDLRRLWNNLETTIEEGILKLTGLCTIIKKFNSVEIQIIPKPRKDAFELFKNAKIDLPDAIPHRNLNVYTRKKLVKERKL